ncbi:MAG: prolyl oligopeptidase family serine peptidase [Planctomycetota bacterium]
MSINRTLLLALAVMFCPGPSADAVAADKVTVGELLTTGPMPFVPPLMEGEPSALKVSFLPELEPKTAWPAAGERLAARTGGGGWTWRAISAGDEGIIPLETESGPMLEWFALYLRVDRCGSVGFDVKTAGAARLFVDGEQQAEGEAADAKETHLEKKVILGRGTHRLLLRSERPGDAGGLTLRLEAQDEQRIETSVDPRHGVTDYNEWREIVSLSGLKLSPDGELMAFSRNERVGDANWSRLDVLRRDDGTTVAASLGGTGSRALAWCGGSERLLYQNGKSLFTWQRSDGEVRQVLPEEPGLGSVAWSKDGSFIVFSSTRGAPEKKKGPGRKEELREKLSDWPRDPHLHLLMLESGVRRRVAVPGDWLQDGFEILPDSRRLLYLRNLPMDQRPWFFTEFRIVDLTDGTDRLVGNAIMGFENRPGLSGLAVSPDGEQVAFVGPPSELGEMAHVEVNAFDPNLWVMDLADGSLLRVTREFRGSVDGHLSWTPEGSRIRFLATVGSESRLVQAELPREEGQPVRFEWFDVGGEVASDISLADDGSFASLASSATRPGALYFCPEPGRSPLVILEPNASLSRRWQVAEPVDVSYQGPDGSLIEAWLYRPERVGDERLPLVVYYYGGATPTMRGFNVMHQYLVAHGYAVLAMNPRGAGGYGEAFSNQHVAEWGERAGADIIAGVETILKENGDLDPDRIGCYGGSYGGFMTLWLISHCDLFGAAVSMYGISNIASYWGDGTWGYTYGDQAINRYPWSHPEWFTRHSPLFQADRIKTPLLLLHGESDTNVPVGESEQMFTALKLLGRTVELVRFPGEDHGIVGSWENRVLHRAMLLEWFDLHLRQQPAAWEARWK